VTEDYHHEADRIALYLVGEHAGQREKRIYAEAMEKLRLCPNASETALWDSMLASTRRMAWADAGLALLRPDNKLRQKLFIMLAILETSPDYARYFLSRPVPPRLHLSLVGAGIRSVFRGIAGVIMVKLSKLDAAGS